MFKSYKVNIDKNHRPYVKLTFIANADTTVPVYYTKESFIAKKSDETISLKANEQKTTVIDKPEIYRFGVCDYNPSTGKRISANTNIISVKVEGTILDDYRLFDSVTSMTECDVSKMDTSKMISMGTMFQLCSKLTTLDLSNFDTSNVTDMDSMFINCEVLTTLDVSKFDTSKVTNMNNMFNNCSVLTTIGPVDTASGWQHKPNNYNDMFKYYPATPKPSWYK